MRPAVGSGSLKAAASWDERAVCHLSSARRGVPGALSAAKTEVEDNSLVCVVHALFLFRRDSARQFGWGAGSSRPSFSSSCAVCARRAGEREVHVPAPPV